MGVRKAIKEFLGEPEPPKFLDFTDEQIYEMIDFWRKDIERLNEELRNELWAVEGEEEDYMKNAKLHYEERKTSILNQYKEKINKLQALVNALYERLQPKVGK